MFFGSAKTIESAAGDRGWKILMAQSREARSLNNALHGATNRGFPKSRTVAALLNIILFSVLISFIEICGFCADAGSILETGKKRHSQFNEELVVRDYFNDSRDGFFVMWAARISAA